MLRECWIYTLLRSVRLLGVNLERICSYGSELVLPYLLSCISNPCKRYKRLQIGNLVLVVVSFSPTALILHNGADRSLWLHSKALEELETKPQCFIFPFLSVNFLPLCVLVGQLRGASVCWVARGGLGIALGYHQPEKCWRQRRFWDF